MSRILNPRVLGTVAAVLAVLILSRILFPVPLPGIQLPAEPIHLFGDVVVPNTGIALVITDIILLVLAYFATRNMTLVPSGLQNVVEFTIEAFYNLAEDFLPGNPE